MMKNRLIEEWAPQQSVLLAWPHKNTDWHYMLDEAVDCFKEIAKAITTKANLVIATPEPEVVANDLKDIVDLANVKIIAMPTNDTWARDFGFISFIREDGSLGVYDYKFNGWGLKFAADKDNLITRNLIKEGCLSADTHYSNRLSFVLEGGSIETDGRGTLLTTSECLLTPNRNGGMTREEIQHQLVQDFGCPNMLWLDYGFLAGDDTDSHIDTLARLLPNNAIAYSSCDRQEDIHYAELHKMQAQLSTFADIEGKPFRLIPLPIPNPIYDADGLRLPATYANFLLLNEAVLLPVYGDEHYDAIAIERMQNALPTYKIIPIDCRALIQQHGSLHCVTMQIPRGVLKG